MRLFSTLRGVLLIVGSGIRVLYKNKFMLNSSEREYYYYLLKIKLKAGSIYDKYIERTRLSGDELKLQSNTQFVRKPLISILVPTYNTAPFLLDELFDSFVGQTYSNWELCIADASTNPETKNKLVSWLQKETRIKVLNLKQNKGIGENTNESYTLATGEFIGLCDHDDVLPANALFEVVKSINNNPEIDFIYTDQDNLTSDGKTRYNPFFKPDWSPDTMRSHNYISHLTIIRRDLYTLVGGFREGFNGAQDYDLFLRATEKAHCIEHIPKILYNWRVYPTSVASDPDVKAYAYASGERALKEHLARIGLEGTVEQLGKKGFYRIKYKLQEEPLISIIIPNKDLCSDLKRCIDSILAKSTYPNYEIIIIENNSRTPEIIKYYSELEKSPKIKVVIWKGEYNYSAINNFGVKHANGKYYLLLNNDTEVITPSWLQDMLAFAQREDVDVVGPKLYYPDKTIQHAGVVVGIGGFAGHAHKSFPRSHIGYFARLIIDQNVSAVTGACLMIKAKTWQELGGLDENLKIALNDIDLCLRVRQTGKLIVFTPFVELYHFESKSRGYENTPQKARRLESEVEYFRKRWKEFLEKGDPYYNINLTLTRQDYSLKLPSEFKEL